MPEMRRWAGWAAGWGLKLVSATRLRSAVTVLGRVAGWARPVSYTLAGPEASLRLADFETSLRLRGLRPVSDTLDLATAEPAHRELGAGLVAGVL